MSSVFKDMDQDDRLDTLEKKSRNLREMQMGEIKCQVL